MPGATFGDGAGLVEARVAVGPNDRTRNGIDLGGDRVDITECPGHHDDVAVGRLTEGGGLISKISVQVGPDRISVHVRAHQQDPVSVVEHYIDAVRAGRADHDLLVQLALGETASWIFVNLVDLRGKASARQKKAENCNADDLS